MQETERTNRAVSRSRETRLQPRTRLWRGTRPAWTTAAVLALLTLAAACTGSPPEILRAEVRLEYVDNFDLQMVYEQLSAFVLVRDEDGFGDIRRLYLIHDQAELYWQLEADAWTHRRISGEDWIGFAGATMADGSEMPRGRYRLVVMDAAGESDERAVAIDAPQLETVRARMPRFDSSTNRVTIPGSGARLVSFTDQDDDPGMRDRVLSPGEYTVSELLRDQRQQRAADSLPVYVYVELGSHYGSLSGPLRP